jgi:hypothetical protein
MSFEVLLAVKMLMLVFKAEEGVSVFLQSVGICLEVHIALQPKRLTSTKVSLDMNELFAETLMKFPLDTDM